MATKSLETDKLTKALAKIPGCFPEMTKVFVRYLSEFAQGKRGNNVPGLRLEMVGRLLSDFAEYCARFEKEPDPDPKAEEWADINQWFGKNHVMTLKAYFIHAELVSEGYDTESDMYYAEIDERMKKEERK